MDILLRAAPTRSDRLTAALGRGLLAGLAGTAAMTVSSTLEARASGRGASTTPADSVGEVLHVQPEDPTGEQRLNTLTHWAYGTAWGLARSALDLGGLRGVRATVLHGAAVLGAEQALLPALGTGRPTPAYGATATATDLAHHVVYAVVTGLVYDRLERG